MQINANRREDVVVSVCLVSEAFEAIDAVQMTKVADNLTTRFRYWEMLLAVPAEKAHAYENLLATVPNLRLLTIRVGVPFYRRRTAVVREAIGDVVVLTVPDELSSFDFVDLLDTCDREGAILTGRRKRRGLINPVLNWLGRGAGFRVDERDMLTVAFPRAILNQILSHPEHDLALRFPPLDHSIPVQWRLSHVDGRRAQPYAEFGRRLGLVHKLIISSAPRVLTLVSFISVLVMMLAMAFGIYACVVWLTVQDVQPGWFTTSMIQSLTATFLAWAIFGVSIGVHKVLETVTNDTSDDVVGERSAVDMFDHVFHDLNVSVEHHNEAVKNAIPTMNSRSQEE